MAQVQLHSVVRHLRRLAESPRCASATDKQLLESFAVRHDETAFAALVHRYGPLVWGVCRRLLRHTHDAEDVFQAAFLVLARKAGAIPWRDSVSNWLYQVAYRLAAEARTKAARRRFHERRAGALARTCSQPEPTRLELCALLDEELHRLPPKYRTPLLLCYLEGWTSDQAARQLGWSVRTLHRRLAQGRELLRQRLIQRGVTLSAALLLPALAPGGASAAVPGGLVTSTIKTGLAFAAGTAEVPVPIAAVANEFLKEIAMTRWKLVSVLVLALSAMSGGGVLLQRALVPKMPAAALESRAAAEERLAGPREDKPAVPMPPGLQPDAFANEVWDIMEIVTKQHFEPCPREEMVLAGVQAMLKAAKTPPPANLGGRAAALKKREEFAAFLRDVWPTAAVAPPRTKLQEALIEGLCARVPGEVKRIPTQELKVAEQVSNNRYVGIGIQIGIHKDEKLIQILNPFRRGAARKAGILPGDLIVQVDGKDTHDVPLSKVVEWLRGEEGTSVTVVVRQPGAKETRTYKMTRAVIPFDTVFGYRRVSEENWDYHAVPNVPIAYVRIGALNISTLHDLRQVEPLLRAEGFRAVVLDLRFAGGSGELRHAALTADGLLDGGVMWSYRGANDQSRKEFHADRECVFRDLPMVVLINQTLTRAESLIAAALQDNGRAVLVGEPDKMDGYVNTVVQLPGGKNGLVIPTGRLERAAKDRSWPVKPDHVIPMNAKQQGAVVDWHRVQEVDGPAGNAKVKPPADPQLDKAVVVLQEVLKKAEKPVKP
jgi:C-terminal peptidase prc